MTVIVDYASLQTRIKEVLKRNDLDAEVTSFIQLADEDLFGDVKHPRFHEEIQFTAADRVPLPLDYGRVINMISVGVGAIDYYPMAEFNDLVARTVGGRIYTIIGENIRFAPYVVGSTVSLEYRRNPDTLSDSNPTNWMLATFPSAYLYGALKHSAVYLVEDDRLETWRGLYEEALARIEQNALDYVTPQYSRMIKRKVV